MELFFFIHINAYNYTIIYLIFKNGSLHIYLTFLSSKILEPRLTSKQRKSIFLFHSHARDPPFSPLRRYSSKAFLQFSGPRPRPGTTMSRFHSIIHETELDFTSRLPCSLIDTDLIDIRVGLAQNEKKNSIDRIVSARTRRE